MRARTTGVAALLFVCALCAGAAAPDRPAAPGARSTEDAGVPFVRVNGQVIGAADVEGYLRVADSARQAALASVPMSALEREELEIQRKREALQALVERHLLYEAARERYMQGPSTEKALDRIVEQELEKFEARVGSKLKAMQLFSDLGLSVEDYKELQRQNILGAKLLWDEVHARVHVMPSEARAYYDERRDEFSIPRTVVYRQILFAVVDEEEESAQREQAASVLEELRGGADFAELARRHSADCEEHAGGLHEVAIPEDCADWMPPAVEGLTPGQVSDVRTVAGGFAIVKLEEVRPPRVPPFEEVQGAIKAALIERKRAEAQAEFIEELKQKAQIEYYPAGRRLGL